MTEQELARVIWNIKEIIRNIYMTMPRWRT